MIVRIFIWSLFDSKTTIDELRESLPALEPPSEWIWNEAADRFGLVLFGEEVTEAVGWVRDLIGDDADVYEEFDVFGT
jgi:hypothetical protein